MSPSGAPWVPQPNLAYASDAPFLEIDNAALQGCTEGIAKKVFPYSFYEIFNKLPGRVRNLFGTPNFNNYLKDYLYSLCQHKVQPKDFITCEICAPGLPGARYPRV